MYQLNGIIYGDNEQESIKVESVKVLPDYIYLVTFNNGEIRVFDLTELSGPAFEGLKEKHVVENPEIDHGIVTWADGSIDCSPEYMYDHSYQYSMAI